RCPGGPVGGFGDGSPSALAGACAGCAPASRSGDAMKYRSEGERALVEGAWKKPMAEWTEDEREAVKRALARLEEKAQRIRDRAIGRGGELLLQVKPQKGKRTDLGRSGTQGRDGAAKAAGLSSNQAKAMLRVASVPEQEFEQRVEASPPA